VRPIPRDSPETEIRALPLIPKADEHEPFGVWYERIADFYAVSPSRLSERIGLSAHFGYRRDFLHRPIKNKDLYRLCQGFRVSRAFIERLFLNQHESISRLEAGVCTMCHGKSILTNLSRPTIRRTTNPYLMLCARHESLLTSAKRSSPKLQPTPRSDFDPDIRLLAVHLCATSQPTARFQTFALESEEILKRVCRDVLDALLFCSQKNDGGSTMTRFALLLGADEISGALAVRADQKARDLMAHINNFEHRRWAMGMCSVLLQASLVDHLTPQPLFSGSGLRRRWLWALLSQESFDILLRRSRGWPKIYVAQCWHELAPFYPQQATRPSGTLHMSMRKEHSAWHAKHGVMQRSIPESR
jgi:hypothetical protein